MTDYKKLVELIDEVAEADVIKMGGEWVAVINIDEIADHLIANGVAVNCWRDAKTDPPPQDEVVWHGPSRKSVSRTRYARYGSHAPFFTTQCER